MLHDPGLLQDLEAHAYSTTGVLKCLYGDPAYPLRVHLQGPFWNPHPTALMEAYNNSMSSVRVYVEWLFGDIMDYFKFMDFKNNLKIGMSSISIVVYGIYIVLYPDAQSALQHFVGDFARLLI